MGAGLAFKDAFLGQVDADDLGGGDSGDRGAVQGEGGGVREPGDDDVHGLGSVELHLVVTGPVGHMVEVGLVVLVVVGEQGEIVCVGHVAYFVGRIFSDVDAMFGVVECNVVDEKVEFAGGEYGSLEDP